MQDRWHDFIKTSFVASPVMLVIGMNLNRSLWSYPFLRCFL